MVWFCFCRLAGKDTTIFEDAQVFFINPTFLIIFAAWNKVTIVESSRKVARDDAQVTYKRWLDH
ncbi:MAG: hypothetical protein IJ776_09115 [Paludibacteraceae bacterium]|nr:hypothetical protein [Paludibacteraceae bacterium]